MAPRSSRARSSGFVMLALCGICLVKWGRRCPAYSVKGSWEGNPKTLKTALRGSFSTLGTSLEPQVKFPCLRYQQNGLALSVEDGRLHADYSTSLDEDTQLNVNIDDYRAWKANLLGRNVSLRVRGQGTDLDTLSWEGSKFSNVDNVGDVKVHLNSDSKYNLTVGRRLLARIGGADVEGQLHATNGGVRGRLDARRVLPCGAQASYSIENPAGIYQLGRSTHRGQLTASVGGGDVTLEAQRDESAQSYGASFERDVLGGRASLSFSDTDGDVSYDVSYARRLDDMVAANADVHVGVDDDGVYGKATAQKIVGGGIGADCQAFARMGSGENRIKNWEHAVKLSHKLGYAQLVHKKDGAPRLFVGYDIDA
eukprot:TRINITY_DN73776_c0_g1_i1.p1 TRINITY_DN73776_c0_g1~~TRINITY_DN73776_c0_g1_i1.p1  ORF type:complete len:416 (-),score=48.58 TRINITY_DN73776_c0_g1_i1:442-1545(-)